MGRRVESGLLFLMSGAGAIGAWPVMYFGLGALAELVPTGQPQNLVTQAYKLLALLIALFLAGLVFIAISRASKRIWLAGLLGLIVILISLVGLIGSWWIAECHGYGRSCL